MYLEHFHLKQLPFAPTPDTAFYVGSAGMQEAFNVVLLALATGEGFIKITGEAGSGKTLLCRKLLKTLEPGFVTIFLPNPLLDIQDLYKAMADELAIPFDRDLGFQRFLRLVTERLITLAGEGKRVALLVDEAQAMPEESLEALRLMSNLETEKRKILQVVLFAQSSLDAMLERPSLRSLKLRISFSQHLPPLSEGETMEYLAHRLHVAGAGDPIPLAPAAMARIHRASGGVPRLINTLAHKALIAAFGEGAPGAGERHVAAAEADTPGALPAATTAAPAAKPSGKPHTPAQRREWSDWFRGLAVQAQTAVPAPKSTPDGAEKKIGGLSQREWILAAATLLVSVIGAWILWKGKR